MRLTAFQLNQRKGLIACVLVWFICWGTVGLLLNGSNLSIGQMEPEKKTGESRGTGRTVSVATRDRQASSRKDFRDSKTQQQNQHIGAQSQKPLPASRQGRLRRLEATAYSYTSNRTASGTWPKRGTMAVDTRYFPFGTLFYVEGYGWAVAEDRGGVIRGDKPVKGDGKANLDLFFETPEEANRWGRRVPRVWDYGCENDLKPEYLPIRLRIPN